MVPTEPGEEDKQNKKVICCTQKHDGDDPFYIREFHISMRHYVYY